MKAVVIALLSVAGLILLVVIGLFVFFAAHAFGSFGKHEQTDYANTAAKIAAFSMPPGYRFRSALDLYVLDEVVIEPVAARDFIIVVQGISTPAASPSDLSATYGRIVGGLDPDHTCVAAAGGDRLKTAHGTAVDFQQLHCTRKGKPRIIEFARIPAKVPLAILVGSGSVHSFDREALRALAQSIR